MTYSIQPSSPRAKAVRRVELLKQLRGRPELPSGLRSIYPFKAMRLDESFFIDPAEHNKAELAKLKAEIARYNRTFRAHFRIFKIGELWEIARLV